MNWLDLIIILILLGGVASGFKNGFVGEIASLAGLVLGIWGAIRFSGWTASLLEGLGLSFSLMPVVAFIVTFLIITIIMQIVAGLVSNLLKVLALNWVNKVAGILAGIFKAALFASVILMVWDAFDQKKRMIPEKTREESMLYEPVYELVPTLLPFLKFDDLRNAGVEEEKGTKNA